MSKASKIIAVVAIAAAVGLASLAVPKQQAKAQYYGYGAYNPISSWIVLNGLFNPYLYGRGYGYGYGVGGYNPVSQWIVLSGLFNPYYGYGGY
ncbi:MAG: hypothetical protein M1383_00780 [Patescibacteria group bacterium]|nr:hypothetical protein [Patescibacteria group bacterium]